MNRIITGAFFLLFLIGCTRDRDICPPEEKHPPMHYKNLRNVTVPFEHFVNIDLDENGTRDVAFSTLRVGDGVLRQERWEWYVTTSFHASLPVNESEEIPSLRLDEPIPVTNFKGYEWFNASAIILARKIYDEQVPPFWQGTWKDAAHRFVPVQVNRQGALYNGWVELSFDTRNEVVVLHRAAISQEAGKQIRAGN